MPLPRKQKFNEQQALNDLRWWFLVAFGTVIVTSVLALVIMVVIHALT